MQNVLKLRPATQHLPQLEVGVVHAVGESLTANTDTLQHTVTGQLVHDQVGIDEARLLQLVGNDATHEVRLGRAQSGHQVVKLLLVRGGDGSEATSLLSTSSLLGGTATRLSGVIGEDLDQQLVGGLLQLVDNSVVEGILVLLQPSGDVVRHASGIMAQSEVGGLATGLRGSGLAERRRLAQMVVVQLLGEGGISGLGEHRLFLQDGQDTHGLSEAEEMCQWLFDRPEVNSTRMQIL